MDSVFISAVNLPSPCASASLQSFPLSHTHTHTYVEILFVQSLFWIPILRIACSWGWCISSELHRIELLLFHLARQWQSLPLSWDRRWARASCFMLIGCFDGKSCWSHVLFSDGLLWKLTTGNFQGRDYLLLCSLCYTSVFICMYFFFFLSFLFLSFCIISSELLFSDRGGFCLACRLVRTIISFGSFNG